MKRIGSMVFPLGVGLVLTGSNACVPASSSSSSTSASSSGNSSSTSRNPAYFGQCDAEAAPRAPGYRAWFIAFLAAQCERERACRPLDCAASQPSCDALEGLQEPSGANPIYDTACGATCLTALGHATCADGATIPAACQEAQRRFEYPPPDLTSLGAPCRDIACSNGLFCSSLYDNAGVDGLSSSGGRRCPACEQKREVGAGCAQGAMCTTGYCASGGPPTCREQLEDTERAAPLTATGMEGTACAQATDCLSGVCGSLGRCVNLRKPVGAPCAEPRECATAVCTGGQCVCGALFPGNGEPCTGSCAGALSCVRQNDGSDRCQAPLADGQPCAIGDSRSACEHVCVAQQGGLSGTCVPWAQVPGAGQSCGAALGGAACATGTVAITLGNGTCVCSAALPDGAYCDPVVPCEHTCQANRCTTLRDDGTACDFGFQCLSGTCVGRPGQCGAPLANGETCFSFEECASKSCAAGVCSAKRDAGGDCIMDEDCNSGFCVANLCVDLCPATSSSSGGGSSSSSTGGAPGSSG